jgi:hypothetical protein
MEDHINIAPTPSGRISLSYKNKGFKVIISTSRISKPTPTSTIVIMHALIKLVVLGWGQTERAADIIMQTNQTEVTSLPRILSTTSASQEAS